jgi:hypothetical protein
MQPNDDNTLINGVGFTVPVINKVWTFLRRGCEKCLPVTAAFVHSKAIKQQWIAIVLQVGQSNK